MRAVFGVSAVSGAPAISGVPAVSVSLASSVAAATSPEYFSVANGVLTSWFGDLVLSLSLLAFWYHALGGLRHLYWDNGGNMEVDFAEKLGWGMIVGSVVLTLLTIIVV